MTCLTSKLSMKNAVHETTDSSKRELMVVLSSLKTWLSGGVVECDRGATRLPRDIDVAWLLCSRGAQNIRDPQTWPKNGLVRVYEGVGSILVSGLSTEGKIGFVWVQSSSKLNRTQEPCTVELGVNITFLILSPPLFSPLPHLFSSASLWLYIYIYFIKHENKIFSDWLCPFPLPWCAGSLKSLKS